MDTPTPRPQTCLGLLTWLDAWVDRFNGDQDPRSKWALLDRRAVWRRSIKYSCEDVNDALDTFFDLASGLPFDPALTGNYRQALEEAFKALRKTEKDPKELAFYDTYEPQLLAALDARPAQVLDAVHAISGHKLWLRVALLTDPGLPAPWPLFPAALHRSLARADSNFKGGSENWTRDNHDDATWARRSLLQEFTRLGWWSQEEAARALSKEEEAELEYVQDCWLKRKGIVRVK